MLSRSSLGPRGWTGEAEEATGSTPGLSPSHSRTKAVRLGGGRELTPAGPGAPAAARAVAQGPSRRGQGGMEGYTDGETEGWREEAVSGGR